MLFLTACPPPQIPPELISLDPGQLGQVDAVSLEQQREERAERLVRAQAGGCRWHSSGCSGRMGWCKTRLCWALGSRALSLCPPPLQGYDPEAKEPFSPRRRLKGRDSASGRLKRRKKVAAEEQQVSFLGFPHSPLA